MIFDNEWRCRLLSMDEENESTVAQKNIKNLTITY